MILMAKKKIDLMLKEFGYSDGHSCCECSNLRRSCVGARTVYKCQVYGSTGSQASDWAKWYPACGMLNRKWDKSPVMALVHKQSNCDDGYDIPGQMQIKWG